jgi:DNA-directed RNA polymerase sigma subunit (sigma70/sigma32)
MNEEIEKKIKEIISRLANLETHIINLIIPIQNINSLLSSPNDLLHLISLLSRPIVIEDRFLRSALADMKRYIDEIKKYTEKPYNTDSEYLFIGKKLHEIKEDIRKIKDQDIKKKISLEFSCDGYELVKRPRYYDKEEPIEEPDNYIKDLLKILLPAESKVIIHRLGLLGENPKTYTEIGKILGVTIERVRQRYSKALRKLRAPRQKELMNKITHKELKKAVFGE